MCTMLHGLRRSRSRRPSRLCVSERWRRRPRQGNVDCRAPGMNQQPDPRLAVTPPDPDDPAADGEEAQAYEEPDPHPDTPDDFDEEAVPERDSVETVIEKD